MWKWRETYDPLLVYRPRTWLLREGWMRGASGPIFCYEVPSSTPVATYAGRATAAARRGGA